MVEQDLRIVIVHNKHFLAQIAFYLNNRSRKDSDFQGGSEGPLILYNLIVRVMGRHDRMMICDAVRNKSVLL